MPSERLLERLRRTEENPLYRGEIDSPHAVESIMVHLQKLLNTRQGSTSIAPDYGVPDFTNLVSNYNIESLQELASAIQKIIQKYEPRLNNVSVMAEPQGLEMLELRFKITGKLKMDNQHAYPVIFRTVVDPDGRVKINH